jgi:hypothetical protein
LSKQPFYSKLILLPPLSSSPPTSSTTQKHPEAAADSRAVLSKLFKFYDNAFTTNKHLSSVIGEVGYMGYLACGCQWV